MGAVGTYGAAVVIKDYDGKVHVNKDEMATWHGAWAPRRSVRWLASCFRPRLGHRRGGRGHRRVSGHLWRRPDWVKHRRTLTRAAGPGRGRPGWCLLAPVTPRMPRGWLSVGASAGGAWSVAPGWPACAGGRFMVGR